jgi:hypothetical protein
MRETKDFDYNAFEKEAILKLQQGVSLEGANVVLAPLLKRLLEAGLQGAICQSQVREIIVATA